MAESNNAGNNNSPNPSTNSKRGTANPKDMTKQQRTRCWEQLAEYCHALLVEAKQQNFTPSHKFQHPPHIVSIFQALGLRAPNALKGLQKFRNNFILRTKYLMRTKWQNPELDPNLLNQNPNHQQNHNQQQQRGGHRPQLSSNLPSPLLARQRASGRQTFTRNSQLQQPQQQQQQFPRHSLPPQSRQNQQTLGRQLRTQNQHQIARSANVSHLTMNSGALNGMLSMFNGSPNNALQRQFASANNLQIPQHQAQMSQEQQAMLVAQQAQVQLQQAQTMQIQQSAQAQIDALRQQRVHALRAEHELALQQQIAAVIGTQMGQVTLVNGLISGLSQQQMQQIAQLKRLHQLQLQQQIDQINKGAVAMPTMQTMLNPAIPTLASLNNLNTSAMASLAPMALNSFAINAQTHMRNSMPPTMATNNHNTTAPAVTTGGGRHGQFTSWHLNDSSIAGDLGRELNSAGNDSEATHTTGNVSSVPSLAAAAAHKSSGLPALRPEHNSNHSNHSFRSNASQRSRQSQISHLSHDSRHSHASHASQRSHQSVTRPAALMITQPTASPEQTDEQIADLTDEVVTRVNQERFRRANSGVHGQSRSLTSASSMQPHRAASAKVISPEHNHIPQASRSTTRNSRNLSSHSTQITSHTPNYSSTSDMNFQTPRVSARSQVSGYLERTEHSGSAHSSIRSVHDALSTESNHDRDREEADVDEEFNELKSEHPPQRNNMSGLTGLGMSMGLPPIEAGIGLGRGRHSLTAITESDSNYRNSWTLPTPSSMSASVLSFQGMGMGQQLHLTIVGFYNTSGPVADLFDFLHCRHQNNAKSNAHFLDLNLVSSRSASCRVSALSPHLAMPSRGNSEVRSSGLDPYPFPTTGRESGQSAHERTSSMLQYAHDSRHSAFTQHSVTFSAQGHSAMHTPISLDMDDMFMNNNDIALPGMTELAIPESKSKNEIAIDLDALRAKHGSAHGSHPRSMLAATSPSAKNSQNSLFSGHSLGHSTGTTSSTPLRLSSSSSMAPHNNLDVLVMFEPHNHLELLSRFSEQKEITATQQTHLADAVQGAFAGCVRYLRHRLERAKSKMRAVLLVLFAVRKPEGTPSAKWAELHEMRMQSAWETARQSKALCEAAAKGPCEFSTLVVPFPERRAKDVDDSVQDDANNFLFPQNASAGVGRKEHLTRVQLLMSIMELLKPQNGSSQRSSAHNTHSNNSAAKPLSMIEDRVTRV